MARRKTSRFKSSIYNCVYWDATSGKWYAQMNYNKQRFYLGTFSDEETANIAVIKKKTELGLINDIPNLDGEVWKPVPRHENEYMASNKGRVKSLNYKTRGYEKILKPFKNTQNGYLSASNLGYIHKLVLVAFIGDSDMIVNHVDGNIENNNLENLEYVSYRENLCHRYLQKKSKIGGSWDSSMNKWLSKISVNGKYITLGYFDTEEQAHLKYVEACIEYGICNKYTSRE